MKIIIKIINKLSRLKRKLYLLNLKIDMKINLIAHYLNLRFFLMRIMNNVISNKITFISKRENLQNKWTIIRNNNKLFNIYQKLYHKEKQLIPMNLLFHLNSFNININNGNKNKSKSSKNNNNKCHNNSINNKRNNIIKNNMKNNKMINVKKKKKNKRMNNNRSNKYNINNIMRNMTNKKSMI